MKKYNMSLSEFKKVYPEASEKILFLDLLEDNRYRVIVSSENNLTINKISIIEKN